MLLILLTLLPSPVRCQPILQGISPDSMLYTSGEVFSLIGQGFSPDDKIILIGSPPRIIMQKPAIDPNKNGADITAIHIRDTHAYIIEDPATIHILDIEDPDQPRLIGSLTNENFKKLKQIWATKKFLYLTDSGYGIWVLDISDPNLPSFIGGAYAPSTFGLYVKEEFIYSTNWETGLKIFIQFPDGKITEWGSSGYTSGTPYDVFVKENLAYVATGTTVQIFDVAIPSNPIYKSQIDHIPSESANIQKLLIKEKTLYIGDRHYGIHIADLSTPTDPQIISSLSLQGEIKDIFLCGPYALVANGFNGLQIIDLHEKENPSIFGNIYTFGDATAISSFTYYIYVANGYAGLSIVEAPSLVHPNLQVYKNTKDNIWAITSQDRYAQGRYAYISNGGSGLKMFQTYPIWDPNVSTIQPEESKDLTTYSFVKEDILYIAETTKLKTYDISNILDPKLMGTFDKLRDTIMSIFVQDKYAYIANLLFGAQSVKIDDPGKMEQAGYEFSSGLAYDIILDRNLAYLANDQEGLWIVDFQIPSDPIEISKLPQFEFAHSLKKYNDLIYMTNGSHGIEIINVSDPNRPYHINTIDYADFLKGIGIESPFNDFLREIEIEFPFLYAAGDYQGIWINHLSKDGEVTAIDVINLPYGASAVKSDGDLLYCGDDYGNFYIFSSPIQAQIVSFRDDRIIFRLNRDLPAGFYDILLIRKSEAVYKLKKALNIYQSRIFFSPGLNIFSYPGLVPLENAQAFSLLKTLAEQVEENNLHIQKIMWMEKTDSESESFLTAYMDSANQSAGENFDILPLRGYPVYAIGKQKKEYFLASHPLKITKAELIKRLKSEITPGRNLISLPFMKDNLIKSSELITSESQPAASSIQEWDATQGKWYSGYNFFNTVNGKVKNLIGGHGYLVSIP